MSYDLAKSIEEWFRRWSDESEFVCMERGDAYTVIGPSTPVAPFIFATKPAHILPIVRSNPEVAIGLIGRYGLPIADDASWICDLLGKRPLIFLGDMDPVDLMVFAWLRARFHHTNVTHLGVSDSYLKQLRVELPPTFIMSCAPCERAALSFLETVLPDLCDVVGPHCTGLLHEGRKIELEAVISALGYPTPLLDPVMM